MFSSTVQDKEQIFNLVVAKPALLGIAALTKQLSYSVGLKLTVFQRKRKTKWTLQP